MGHRVDTARAHWVERTADRLEDDLIRLVLDLTKESAKLGEISRTSKDYKLQRARVAEMWKRVGPSVADLRAVTTRETKRTARDALHARLCEIERRAAADPTAINKPYVAWKMAIDGVITWLDSWMG
jgi:hypothetical protein